MKNHVVFTGCPHLFLSSILSELPHCPTFPLIVPVTESLRIKPGDREESRYGQQLDGLEISNRTLCFDL